MPDAFECPLAQVKIVSCPVRTCAYNTSSPSSNCLMHLGLTEDVEFNADEISKAKGMDPQEFRSAAQKGQRAIQRTLVLHDFLLYLDARAWDAYPYVAGYHDAHLIQWVEHNLLRLPPFNLSLLSWNMGKIACAVTDKVWKEYCKVKEIDFVSTSVALGLPKRLIEGAQLEFKTAHKRASQKVPA